MVAERVIAKRVIEASSRRVRRADDAKRRGSLRTVSLRRVARVACGAPMMPDGLGHRKPARIPVAGLAVKLLRYALFSHFGAPVPDTASP